MESTRVLCRVWFRECPESEAGEHPRSQHNTRQGAHSVILHEKCMCVSIEK